MASTVNRSQSNRAPLGWVEWEIRMDVQPTNLQQLRDASCHMDQNLEECFQHLLNLCHEELKQF